MPLGINPDGLGTTTSTPTGALKQYIDNARTTLSSKEECRLATTANLDATYDSAAMTLTANNNGQARFDTTDGSVGNRILVRLQTNAKHNGIYAITVEGDFGTPYVLTRAADHDGSPQAEVRGGNSVFITDGDTLINTGWLLLGDGVGSVNNEDESLNWPLYWAQFTTPAYDQGLNTTDSVAFQGIATPTVSSTGALVLSPSTYTTTGKDLRITGSAILYADTIRRQVGLGGVDMDIKTSDGSDARPAIMIGSQLLGSTGFYRGGNKVKLRVQGVDGFTITPNGIEYPPASSTTPLVSTTLGAAVSELDSIKLNKAGGTLSGALILPTGNPSAMALGIGSQTSTHGFFRNGDDIRVHVRGVEVAYFDVGGFVSNRPTYSNHTGNAANPSYTWNAYYTSGLFNNAGTIGLSVSGNAILSITGTTTTMGGNIVMGTGQITIPSGSLANPSIRLSSSANTGIYSSGTTNLSLVSNGVARITASTTGSTLTGTTDISTLTNCGYAVIYDNVFSPAWTDTNPTIQSMKLTRLWSINGFNQYFLRIVISMTATTNVISCYIPEFTGLGLSNNSITIFSGSGFVGTGTIYKYTPDFDGLTVIRTASNLSNGSSYTLAGEFVGVQGFD